MLYKIQSKDNTQSLDITVDKKDSNTHALDKQLDESCIKLNTSNNTIMSDQAIADHHEDDKSDHDDDLNIIPLNTWSTKKYQTISDSNNNASFNMKMREVQESNASSLISISPMNMHKYDNSSVDTSIIRDSCIKSNTKRYGQPSSKPQFQKQLMIHRLRRKRKYDRISNNITNHNNDDIDCISYEPPKKKTNVKGIDLMSSRDLKNEIKRIHKTKGNNAILTRKNLLLRKSVQKLSTISSSKNQQKIGVDPKKRIKNVMKKVFKLSIYFFY